MIKINPEDGITTLISKGTKITGTITFSGNVEVEGEISGDIVATGDAKSRLHVMEHGRITGQVRAPIVVVSGQIKGDVYASEQLDVASKGIVEGRVYYKSLEVNKGATVKGELSNEVKDDAQSRPADKQVSGAKEKRAASAVI